MINSMLPFYVSVLGATSVSASGAREDEKTFERFLAQGVEEDA